MVVIFHVLGMLLDRGALATYNQTIAYKGEPRMSFEVFEKLEAKVQQAIDTITLLQMEIEELKEKIDLCLRRSRMQPAAVSLWLMKMSN